MFRMVSESMLANVIAFEEAGVPRQELKQAVGQDGRTIIGRGIVLHTPIKRHLSDGDARSLRQTYVRLIGDYNEGFLRTDYLHAIKMRNDVASKVDVSSKNLQKKGKRSR